MMLDVINTTEITLVNSTIAQTKWGIFFINYTWRFTFGILYILAGTAAVLFNGVVVMAMQKGNAMHENSCRILCALALTDFITGLSGYLNICEAVITHPIIQTVVINIRYTLNTVTLISSLNLAVFVSYDRYLHMSRLKQRWRMPRMWSNAGIAICWGVPIVTAGLCVAIKNKEIWLLPSFIGAMNFLLMNVCYILLLRSLQNFTKENSGRNSLDASYIKNERYVTRTIVIIAMFYIIMTFPIIIGLIVRAAIGLNSSLAQFNAVGMYLAFSNSFVNPIIYYSRTRSIRRYVLRMIPKALACGTAEPRTDTRSTPRAQ